MENNKEIFSTIPMKTWRWLGVNEAYLPDELQQLPAGHGSLAHTVPDDVKKSAGTGENLIWKRINVPAGKTLDASVVYRTEQRTHILASVGEGGTLNLTCVQLLPLDRAHAGKAHITVAKGGCVNYTCVELGASETLSDLQIDLEGDQSRADVASVYFGDHDRKIDINYVIRQSGCNTDANMQVRGALKGKSQKIFRGTLDFTQGSKGSVGREKEEVILLNEGIRNRSVPLMLSGEDDVDGHHAVSVGRVDGDKLYYLMSRGLDLNEAQRLVVEASFIPVLERIANPTLKEEIENDIKERISDER